MPKSFSNPCCKVPCKAEKCQKTLITQADIGRGDRFLISRPGLYCLCSDVTFSVGIAIEIAASNVTLDLCQHTIDGSGSGQLAVLIRENEELVENVVVRNGNIVNLAPDDDLDGVFGAALSFFLAKNIIVDKINVSKGTRGALLNDVEGILLRDCRVRNTRRNAFFALKCRKIKFENCSVHACENVAFSIGSTIGQVSAESAVCVDVTFIGCSSSDTPAGIACVNGSNLITVDGFRCTNAFTAVSLFGVGTDANNADIASLRAVISRVDIKNVTNGVRVSFARNVEIHNCSIQNTLAFGIVLSSSSEIILSAIDVVNENKEVGAIAIGLQNTNSISLSNVDIVKSLVGVFVANSTDFTLKNAQVLNSGAGFLIGRFQGDEIVKYALLQDCRAINCDAFGFAILRNEQTHLDQCIANSSERGDPRVPPFRFNYGIFLSQCACCLVKQCKANFNFFGFAEAASLDENAFIGNCAFANVRNYAISGKNTVKTIATAQSAFDNVQYVKDSKRSLNIVNDSDTGEKRVRSMSSKASAMLDQARDILQ